MTQFGAERKMTQVEAERNMTQVGAERKMTQVGAGRFSVLGSFFDDFWLQFGWCTSPCASLGPVGCSWGVPDAPKCDF